MEKTSFFLTLKLIQCFQIYIFITIIYKYMYIMEKKYLHTHNIVQ